MIVIPTPETLLAVTWFLIGFCFGRGLGKRLDQEIQASYWFRRRSPVVRGTIRRLLDCTHHFWIGLLLMVYSQGGEEVFWFGCGLFVDDWPDIPRRYRKLFTPLGELLNRE